MKFKVGEVWRTRDGRKARIICTDRMMSNRPIIALIVCNRSLKEKVETYGENGFDIFERADHDLIEPWRDEPEEVEVFEWMYQSSFGVWHFALSENNKDCRFQESKYCMKTGRSWRVPK